jgi:hypothetical protein
MKSVHSAYPDLFPSSSHRHLMPLLAEVFVLHLPEEKKLLNPSFSSSVILVVDKMNMKAVMQLLQMGFKHVVQRGRKDFAKELLVSSLMIAKERAFFKNPIPFFLSGFNSKEVINEPNRQLIMRFTRQREKEILLDRLRTFLSNDRRAASIRDLCIQSADEMISNALFNAPMQSRGKRMFKDMPRDTDIQLPASMAATLFACFSDERVVIGCIDCYGSLNRRSLFDHMSEQFNEDGTGFKFISGGAGLGVRNLIENSANFYVLVDPGKFTLMACGFLLKGIKSNLTAAKHIHFNCD